MNEHWLLLKCIQMKTNKIRSWNLKFLSDYILIILHSRCFIGKSYCLETRGKSHIESWGTTFLPEWQPPLTFVWFTSRSHEHWAILHMHKNFDINRWEIKGGCQSGRKMVTHNSKSDLTLEYWQFWVLEGRRHEQIIELSFIRITFASVLAVTNKVHQSFCEKQWFIFNPCHYF